MITWRCKSRPSGPSRSLNEIRILSDEVDTLPVFEQGRSYAGDDGNPTRKLVLNGKESGRRDCE